MSKIRAASTGYKKNKTNKTSGEKGNKARKLKNNLEKVSGGKSKKIKGNGKTEKKEKKETEGAVGNLLGNFMGGPETSNKSGTGKNKVEGTNEISNDKNERIGKKKNSPEAKKLKKGLKTVAGGKSKKVSKNKEADPADRDKNLSAESPMGKKIESSETYDPEKGQAAVNLARKFLGQKSIDLKGKMPYFQAAGGKTNNCADFVSSALQSQGLLKGHQINVSKGYLRRALEDQGYKIIDASQARAGDVWISSNSKHTELVQGVKDGKLVTIGSNNKMGPDNVREKWQTITERFKELTDGVVYARR